MRTFTVVMTGASGSAYGTRTLRALLEAGHAVTLVVTRMGAEVAAHELGLALPSEDTAGAVLRQLGLAEELPLRVVSQDAMFDAIASGTHPVDGMVVVPCSMGFAGSLAAGLASDVAERAADVCLKERRTLVLVPRETPLNLVHLRNLISLAEAGAVILPAAPGFYAAPRTIDDLVDFVAGKVLDVLGVEHALLKRWGDE